MNVRIFKPSRSATQSGLGKTQNWLIEPEPATKRAQDPLMLWSQCDDTRNQVKISFPSQQAAVDYAQKQGWDYNVEIERQKKVRPRNYMDNFKYVPDLEEG